MALSRHDISDELYTGGRREQVLDSAAQCAGACVCIRVCFKLI